METLKGSCHCGAVEFEVRSASALQGLKRCDSSPRARKGAIMADYPAGRPNSHQRAGISSAWINRWRVARHYFCSICGIYTHPQRRRLPHEYGYNAGSLERLDIENLGLSQ